MRVKKIPMRTCVATKEKLPKQELIRIVRTPEGEVIIDESGKANGRGAYLKKSLKAIEKAKKTKAVSHHLEIEIPEQIFEELKNLV